MMPRRSCHRHGPGNPCTCAMGHLYRFIEPVVLYLLQKKGSSYGYDLARELGEHALTDNTIDRGALYRTLRTLEGNGHVASAWVNGGGGPARRHYHLTPSGERHLQEWAVVLENLSRSMASFVQEIHGRNSRMPSSTGQGRQEAGKPRARG
jgi:PadR family transcriptional regulator, regulatory protein PadR